MNALYMSEEKWEHMSKSVLDIYYYHCGHGYERFKFFIACDKKTDSNTQMSKFRQKTM